MAENWGYELFYSSGGHCGPFYGLADAVETGRRVLEGCHGLQWVDVVERDPHAVGGYGHRVQRIRRTDDDPQPNQMSY